MKSRVVRIIISVLLACVFSISVSAEDKVLRLSSIADFNYTKNLKDPRLVISASINSGLNSKDENDFSANRYVLMVLPFENFTSEPEVTGLFMNQLIQYLRDVKGETLLDDKAVKDFMIKYKIRHTSFLDPSARYAIYNELGVQRVLVGCVVEFSRQTYPAIGVIARLIETKTGRVIWAGYHSVSGDEGFKIFGMGFIEDTDKIVRKAIKGLLSDYTLVSPSIVSTNHVKKVAIVPFRNDTKYYGIGFIASQMYLYEFYKSKRLVPYDLGDVRHLMIQNGIMPTGELTNRIIDQLGRELGVDLILVGSVIQYSRKQEKRVTIFTRLIDVKSKNLVWAGFHTLTGDENVVVFDIGLLRTLDRVLHKIVEIQTKKMERKI